MAIQKWKEYKLIITNGRLKKIAIGTWLAALFPAVASLFTAVVLMGDGTILAGIATVWTAVETTCLFLVAIFYRKVYLGIRNHKLNEISHIDVLTKVKLESKVAKTTSLLTATVISLFISPTLIFAIFVNVAPVFRTTASHRFTQTHRFTQILVHLNSTFNPLLYCYIDHRFRNAIYELLGRKKPEAKQSAVGGAQFFRRNDPFRSPKLHIAGNGVQHLKRSLSCNLTGTLGSIQGKPSVLTMKRSLSVPILDTAP